MLQFFANPGDAALVERCNILPVGRCQLALQEAGGRVGVWEIRSGQGNQKGGVQ